MIARWMAKFHRTTTKHPMKSIPDIYGGKGQTLYYCIGKDCKWQMIG